MAEDDRIIFIKGNHEVEFLENIEIPYEDIFNDPINLSLLQYNECLKTLNDYHTQLSISEKNKIKNFLEKDTYYCAEIINNNNQHLLLSHAGFHYDFESLPSDLEERNRLLVWDRKHMEREDWPVDKNNYYVIHGHTPVQTLNNLSNKIYKYCYNHKIDIDLGCFASKKIALLDLDTLDVIYFSSAEEKKE